MTHRRIYRRIYHRITSVACYNVRQLETFLPAPTTPDQYEELEARQL
jgi:hypothetical protein